MRYSENNILVPYDFSYESESALATAVDLAKLMKVGLTLFHVVDLAPYVGFRSEAAYTYVKDLKAHIAKMISDKLDSLELKDVSIGHRIAEGKTVEKIVEETKGGRYGLVIMGHQKVLVADQIVSCTVEKIMRHTSVPVLSTGGVTQLGKINQIAFATNLETTPIYVVKQLARLQNAIQAKLHIVKINTKEDWIPTREARSQFDRFQAIQKLSNFQFDVYDDKTTEEGVLHYADDIGAGIIAMGIHNSKPGDKMLDHHIAEDVLRRSKQMLWTCTT